MKENKEKIDVKCDECDYEWKTKSKMYSTSCPKCGAKVTLQINIDNDKKKKQEAKNNE